MSTNTMSPLDASFLHIEDDVSHMHIGSVAIFEGPAPPYEEVVRDGRGKLPLVPRYRQVVRFVPLELGRPVWVDDPHFNLELPRPPHGAARARRRGRAAQPRRAGSCPSSSTAPSRCGRSGWSRASSDGRWALLSKIHHCMVDGVSGTDLLSVVLDTTRDAGRRPCPTTGSPQPEPTSARARRRRRSSSASPARTSSAARVRAATRAPRELGQRARRGRRRGCVAMRGSGAADARVDAQRPDRPAPALGLGAHDASRHQDGARRARRHGQRRRARGRSRAASATCCSLAASRSTGRVVRTLVPVSVRDAGRARHLQQPGVGDVRRAAGRDRRPGRAAGRDPHADGRAEGVEAGGGRRGADLADGLRPADAAGAGHARVACAFRSAASTP